jgi:hypothetical protein
VTSELYGAPHKDADGNITAIELYIPAAEIPTLIAILNRALNCWDEAPPQWKHLADMIIHGKMLQNYYAQNSSKQLPFIPPTADELGQ